MRKRKNSPFGIVPPRIARVECLLEAYIALDDDEGCLRRCTRLLEHVRTQRVHNRKAYIAHRIDVHAYQQHADFYDGAEYKVFLLMLNRAKRLRETIKPEVKRQITIAESAA